MEILSFDIEGKFAHFRKYYANNTAFSFGLPPRTTIIGIIAAAMGLEKDSYYEDFCSEKIRIGTSILSPIKKSFHRLNFLMIKGVADFRGKQKHIQTPFEVLSGIDPKTDMVSYRIFIAPNSNGTTVFDKIKSVFEKQKFYYSPTLGTANFIAQIKNITNYRESDFVTKSVNNEYIILDSACLSKNVQDISFEKANEYRFNMLEEELMPADFLADGNRELKKMNRVLFTTGGVPLKIKLINNVYILEKNNQIQTIQFLD